MLMSCNVDVKSGRGQPPAWKGRTDPDLDVDRLTLDGVGRLHEYLA
jgi:hypothetical protein